VSGNPGSASLVGVTSGSVFALGLWLSGMTDPAKVLGFLDFAGDFDPALAFVMAGAVGVHFAWLRWASKSKSEHAAVDSSPASSRPPSAVGRVDAALLVGAGLFGLGWGMAGYCPGPALVALAFGRYEALLFVIAMAGGMGLFNVLRRRADAPTSLRESV
jgi:uncharacterized protein